MTYCVKRYYAKREVELRDSTNLRRKSGNKRVKKQIITLALLLIPMWLSVGCAYYNYFFNAQKHFDRAEKTRKEDASVEKNKKTATALYEKAIDSAGRMLLYYPGSKWEDDALLLIAEAYYRAGKYRSAIGKVDELFAKYPSSPFREKGELYKGLSLLRIAQADSGRVILGQLAAESTDKALVAEVYFGLAEYYFQDDRWEPAYDQYKLATEAGSPDKWLRSAAWVKMGDCLGRLERYEDAVKLYDAILSERIPRRLQFEASLQRASALRSSGGSEEALTICEKLLKDAAFVDDFPRVQLEAGLCEKALGRPEAARKRFEELLEDKKQGATSAQAQYELGLLFWEQWKDYNGAVTALKGVKGAERTAAAAPAADSLLAEVETLTRLWMRMRFIERQQSLIDSARTGLRPLLLADTIWVDSLAAPPKEKALERGRKGQLKGDPNDPIRRMVEAAMAADSLAKDSVAADSAKKTAPADTVAKSLDSLQLVAYDSLRRADRQTLFFNLAEFHLFKRRSNDSALYYFEKLLESGVTGEFWARATASRAYIARSQGDTLASDSLYQLILDSPPSDAWRNRSLTILGRDTPPPVKSQTEALTDSAEAEWRVKGDAEGARMIYLLAAETADSGDTAAARALFSAAYITRVVLDQDSLAGQLYSQVAERFPNTIYAKAAAKHAIKAKKKAPGKDVAPAEPMGDEISDKAEFEALMSEAPPVEDLEEKIYEAADVDELPHMLTLPDIVEGYLRSYYPFDAYPERLRGEVEIEVVILSNGEAPDPKVIKTTPEGYGFDEAALSVFKSIEYRPGRVKGKPVNVKIKQVLIFKKPEDQ